jgi:glucans biosynthesis protein C
MNSGTQRFHAFDALRAIMMLLGLALHAMMPYTTYTKGFFSHFYKDPNTSRLFDVLLFWIHIYRMPVFFVMAGFFALLVYKKGKNVFRKNRFKRIVLPFIIGWIILVPLTRFSDTFARYVSEHGISGAFSEAFADIITVPWSLSVVHLWFLYFLIYMYVFFELCMRMPRKLKTGINSVFRKVMSWRLRALALSVITILFLLLMQTGTYDTSGSFFPLKAEVLISYTYFFSFGVLLFKNSDLVDSLRKDSLWQLVLSVPFFLLHFYYLDLMQDPENINSSRGLIASAAGGLSSWLVVLGITGLSLEWMNKESKVMRFLSESSYWVFLMHVPCVLISIGLLSSFDISAVLKWMLVVLINFILLLVTYQLFVRNTFIGTFLNGKKTKSGTVVSTNPGNA